MQWNISCNGISPGNCITDEPSTRNSSACYWKVLRNKMGSTVPAGYCITHNGPVGTFVLFLYLTLTCVVLFRKACWYLQVYLLRLSTFFEFESKPTIRHLPNIQVCSHFTHIFQGYFTGTALSYSCHISYDGILKNMSEWFIHCLCPFSLWWWPRYQLMREGITYLTILPFPKTLTDHRLKHRPIQWHRMMKYYEVPHGSIQCNST